MDMDTRDPIDTAETDQRGATFQPHSLGMRRVAHTNLKSAAGDDPFDNISHGRYYQLLWTKRGSKLALAVLVCHTILMTAARLLKKQPASMEFDASIFILVGMCLWGISLPLLTSFATFTSPRRFNIQACIIFTIVYACEIWKNTHYLFGDTEPTTDKVFTQAALGMLVPCTASILLLPPMPYTLCLMAAYVVPYGFSPHTDWDFVLSYCISQVLLGVLLYFIHDTIHNKFADRFLHEQHAIALAREGVSTSSVSTVTAEGTGSGCFSVSPSFDQPPTIHAERAGTNAYAESFGQQRSSSGSPPTSSSGMGSHSDQEESHPNRPSQQAEEMDLVARSGKRSRVSEPDILNSCSDCDAPEDTPRQAPEAMLDWLVQNEHMFTLCNSLGENDVPILLNVCHDAVLLANINSSDTLACNRHCRDLFTKLGCGRVEDGRELMLNLVWNNIHIGQIISCQVSCADGTRVHLNIHVRKTRCEKQAVMAVQYRVEGANKPPPPPPQPALGPTVAPPLPQLQPASQRQFVAPPTAAAVNQSHLQSCHGMSAQPQPQPQPNFGSPHVELNWKSFEPSTNKFARM